jgi:2-methylcitrate dehydratase PrpD
MTAHGLRAADVVDVEVATFHEGARLAVRHPFTTEQAQYSLPFPVAATIVYGEITPAMVTGGLDDEAINRLSGLIRVVEDPSHSAAFPGRRLARVTLTLADGRRLESADTEAPGDPHTPLTDAEVMAKFRSYAGAAADGLERASSVTEILAQRL